MRRSRPLSLYFKDVANPDKCPWGSKVVEAALFMSNTINGSERIRSALHKRQEGLLGRASAITVHCPTLFACHYFIVKDLLHNKDALRALVLGDEMGGGVSEH